MTRSPSTGAAAPAGTARSGPRPGRIRRRRVLGAVAAAPAALALGRLTAGALRAVPLARPPAAGSSAGRCAQCGSRGHTMLDPACPSAPGLV
ncbi:MAG TPA: hypothetical protein VFZ79_04075 [Acidimicrobiales bacterium]